MRKIVIGGLLLLLLILVGAVACTDNYPVRDTATPKVDQPTPTAIPTSAGEPEGASGIQPMTTSPCTATLQLVGLLTSQGISPTTQAQDSQLFPLADIVYEDTLGMLALLSQAASESWGTARLALGRPVTSTVKPAAPDPDAEIHWVVLLPADREEVVLAWQDIRQDSHCDGPTETQVVAHHIAETLTFPAAAETTASLEAVDGARRQWADPSGRGLVLWVDALLIEKRDQEGNATWTLYTFAQPPGVPADRDKKTRQCCNWLHCDEAKGLKAKICRFYGCRKAMCRQ